MTADGGVTFEWLFGAGFTVLGVAMAALSRLQSDLDKRISEVRDEVGKNGERIGTLERGVLEFKADVARECVRTPALDSLRSELAGLIERMRCEVKQDSEKAATRAETTANTILRELATLTDSLLRIQGQRRTRATDE